MAAWTTREIRDRAARLLEARGWSPDGLEWDMGPLSANMAIGIASGEPLRENTPEPDGPYLTTVSEIEDELGSLLDWEYAQGRTAEEVVALLRAAPGPPLVRSPEELARRARELERWQAAMEREAEARRQMRERSGPIYETARKRGRIVSAAYKAAGSPRQVVTHWSLVDGRLVPQRHYFVVRRKGKRHHVEPATQADADAWYAWERDRDQLRRKLRATSVDTRGAHLHPDAGKTAE